MPGHARPYFHIAGCVHLSNLFVVSTWTEHVRRPVSSADHLPNMVAHAAASPKAVLGTGIVDSAMQRQQGTITLLMHASGFSQYAGVPCSCLWPGLNARTSDEEATVAAEL